MTLAILIVTGRGVSERLVVAAIFGSVSEFVQKVIPAKESAPSR